jgi:crotonobetainyl-CoA:carnitine CoA-transferase CaiB-like acyl-CoA transferase
VYDVFDTADDGQQVFVGCVTDTQWRSFCEAFGLTDLRDDPELATMAQLAAARGRILPIVQEVFRTIPKAELMARCEAIGLPFAPIARPSDLFDDPHLQASGGLLPIELSRTGGRTAPSRPVADLPGLPVSLGTGRPGLRRQPPRVGEHGAEVMREAGYTPDEVAELIQDGTVRVPETAAEAAG